METIRFKTHVGEDGILKLEIPPAMRNQDLEVVIVMQPIPTVEVDQFGYPIGYFEETYGSFADEPLERPPQGEFEIRDKLE